MLDFFSGRTSMGSTVGFPSQGMTTDASDSLPTFKPSQHLEQPCTHSAVDEGKTYKQRSNSLPP